MKKIKDLGRLLGKHEQQKITGGSEGSGFACGTVCYNCAVLSIRCQGSGVCICTPTGCTCPSGAFFPCPQGNYC